MTVIMPELKGLKFTKTGSSGGWGWPSSRATGVESMSAKADVESRIMSAGLVPEPLELAWNMESWVLAWSLECAAVGLEVRSIRVSWVLEYS
jgi:hypothetical protein